MGKIGILVVETSKASGGAKRRGAGSLQSSGACAGPGAVEGFEKPRGQEERGWGSYPTVSSLRGSGVPVAAFPYSQPGGDSLLEP